MGIFSTLLIGSGLVFGTGKLLDALATKEAGDNLQSDFSTVKWKQPTGGRANFDVKVKHTNPTGGPLSLDKLDLKLKVSGYTVGKIGQQQVQAIPANSTVTHTYRFQSDKWTGLFSTFFKMLLSGNIPEKVNLSGSITANGYSTDINTDLPLKK